MLDRGRLVASGTPGELTGGGAPRLHLRLSRALDTAEAADLAALLARACGGSPAVRSAGAPGAYDVDGLGAAPDPRAISGLAGWCEDNGLLLVELRTGAASLEERYLELVRAPGEPVDGASER